MGIERRTTTQDISWFLDLDRNDQLDLDPSYQRRSVWSSKDRKFFLDTIFRGYPSPAIYMHKQVREGKTVYAVVDGKQRLQTIFRFVSNKIRMDKSYGDIRLNNKLWKDIEDDIELKRHFWDYVIPAEFINIEGDSDLVNSVFDRLNRNSRKLVEQELRHAKFDGWFIEYIENQADEPAWKELGIVTTARAKRMRDVQFMSELLIVIFEKKAVGFSQDQITEYYARYEDADDDDFEFNVEGTKELFEQTRDFLVGLERAKNAVSTNARDFKNFYSLWALVALNLEAVSQDEGFAEKYMEFMGLVQSIKDNPQQDITGDLIKAFDYYESSIGASTEEPQRCGRHNALVAALLD